MRQNLIKGRGRGGAYIFCGILPKAVYHLMGNASAPDEARNMHLDVLKNRLLSGPVGGVLVLAKPVDGTTWEGE